MGTAEMHPETAQMMIINPLSGGDLSGLFRTHRPPSSASPACSNWPGAASERASAAAVQMQ